MTPLVLTTVQEVADYLDEDEITGDLYESLAAARELITLRVVESLSAEEPSELPASLHRACKMTAARLFRRANSTFAVEAFEIGGETGSVLLFDPDIYSLWRPWRRAPIGYYDGS